MQKDDGVALALNGLGEFDTLKHISRLNSSHNQLYFAVYRRVL